MSSWHLPIPNLVAIILLREGLLRRRNRGVRSKRYKPQAPNPQTAIGVSREGAAGLSLRPCNPLFRAVSSNLVDALRDEKLEHDDLEHRRYWKGEQGAEKASQRSSNQEGNDDSYRAEVDGAVHDPRCDHEVLD